MLNDINTKKKGLRCINDSSRTWVDREEHMSSSHYKIRKQKQKMNFYLLDDNYILINDR